MKITDTAANGTVGFILGDIGDHGYVDYLNLLYDVKKSWRISDKVAQYMKC